MNTDSDCDQDDEGDERCTDGYAASLRKFLRQRVGEIYEQGYICGFTKESHFGDEVDIIIDWLRANKTEETETPITQENTMWTSNYDNDVGQDDEYFREFWRVTDGGREYKCDNKDDAEWLCHVLNSVASATRESDHE